LAGFRAKVNKFGSLKSNYKKL